MKLPPTITVTVLTGLLLSSCARRAPSHDAKWWQLEAEKIQLEGQIALLEQKLSRVPANAKSERVVRAEWDKVEGRREALAGSIHQLSMAIRALEIDFRDTKSAVLAKRRQDHTGTEFSSFRNASGREFRDVRISRVTELGVEIRHATGLARLTASDLTSEQRKTFGIDLQRATELLEIERENARTYHQMVDRRLAEQAKEREKAEQRTAVASSPSLPAPRSSAVNTTPRTSILNQRWPVGTRNASTRRTRRSSFYPVYFWNRACRYTPSTRCYPIRSTPSTSIDRNFRPTVRAIYRPTSSPVVQPCPRS